MGNQKRLPKKPDIDGLSTQRPEKEKENGGSKIAKKRSSPEIVAGKSRLFQKQGRDDIEKAANEG